MVGRKESKQVITKKKKKKNPADKEDSKTGREQNK
jgi:hypothetical protein